MSQQLPRTDADNPNLMTLIQQEMLARGLTRRDVCQRLGYANISKAYKVYDEVTKKGTVGGALFISRLAAVLELEPERMQKAATTTRQAKARPREARRKARKQEREALERAEFSPHCWVVPERQTPSPIIAAALFGVGPFLYVCCPSDLAALPFDQQKILVRDIVVQHYAEKSGRAGPFGGIIAYEYRFTFESYWRLSIAGDFLELAHRAAHRVPRTTLTVYGKTFDTTNNGLCSMGGNSPETDRLPA